SLRRAAREQRGVPARVGAGRRVAAGNSQGGRADYAGTNAARMGDARFGAHPAGCGAGEGAEASGCRGSVGKIVSIETMSKTRLFFNLALFLVAGGLPAQTFIQMSDPQFGMFTKDQDFAHETLNFDLPSPRRTGCGRRSWW